MLTLWYIKNTKSDGMFPVMDMTAGMSTFLMGQMPPNLEGQMPDSLKLQEFLTTQIHCLLIQNHNI